MITGKTLLDWGFVPGPWFKSGIAAAQAVEQAGGGEVAMRAAAAALAPKVLPTAGLRRHGEIAYQLNIRPEGKDEIENVRGVEQHMAELMRLPTVAAGAVMPDACVSGSQPGTIPVGGVIATRDAIHPGMHSSDICCSMAVTVFGEGNPLALLDAGMALSQFGPGGRPLEKRLPVPAAILTAFAGNEMLRSGTSAAVEHFATQGDGNHFFYVGRMASSGDIALVTHHGSRRPGALLYKAGMAIAGQHRLKVSPETPAHNAWIPADTAEGETYWNALQILRGWTKASHFAIHDIIAATLGLPRKDRFWNEHNFVFQKSDGLFYHGKGATPAWADYAADASGLTLIPLNMAQPILIARGLNAANGLGFAPHGAGRNMSRSAFMRRNAGKTGLEILREQTAGIDARFFSGIPDLSELPGAYKDADAVRAQIAEFGLAEVVDTIEPIGSIMAGDWQQEAPWRKAKAAKRAARDAERSK